MSGAEPTSREVVLPPSATAARTVRTQLTGFLAECGVRDRVADDAAVIVSELVTNAVRHGSSANRMLQVEWVLDARRLRLRVTDGGYAGAHAALHDHGAVGGRGLSIVAALADSWTFEPAGHGTTVTAVLAVPS